MTRRKARVTDLALAARSSGGVRTVHGPVVHIRDARAGSAEVRVSIQPAQSGSGNPSPENVRPITGWEGLTLRRSGADISAPETIAVSWESEAGTVYVGTLDVTAGVLTVTHGVETFYSSDMFGKETTSAGLTSFFHDLRASGKMAGRPSGGISEGLTMNWLLPASSGAAYGAGSVGASGRYFNIRVREDSTVASLKELLMEQPLQVVYPLGTPLVFQLTPREVELLRGDNTIWADTGDVTVTYRAENPPRKKTMLRLLGMDIERRRRIDPEGVR